jgi:uncharacterized membrane protein YcaP (DUF421 family)
VVAVNSALNRAAVRSDRLARVFDGTDTVVVESGRVDERAARRLGLRRRERDHAVRLQNGDALEQVATGVMDPAGQLVVTLKDTEQGATKGDIDRLTAQLGRIEAALAARAG